jgi:hypothetical protein
MDEATDKRINESVQHIHAMLQILNNASSLNGSTAERASYKLKAASEAIEEAIALLTY